MSGSRSMCVSAALPALLLAGACPPLAAATFSVDSSSDTSLSTCVSATPGDCTLRGALTAANLSAGADTIEFDLPVTDPGFDPVSGSWRIVVGATPLPLIEQPLLIDGYSQPGALPNSITASAGGLDSVLKIQLRPATVGVQQNGLEISGNFFAQGASVLRGLNIAGFANQIVLIGSAAHRVEGCYLGTTVDGLASAVTGNSGRGNGVRINSEGPHQIGGLSPAARNLLSGMSSAVTSFASANGLQVEGNLIGTDRSGSQAVGNITYGLSFSGGLRNARIGGTDPDARNLISGNRFNGLYLSYSGAAPFTGTRVEGNLFGTDVSGSRALGNGRNDASPSQPQPTIGVFGGGSCALQLGGTAPGQANRIAFSGAAGVHVGTCTGFDASANVYVGNRGPAIDISASSNADGLTANDPGDADDGGNRLQNSPVFTVPAGAAGAPSLSVSYQVDTAVANASYPLTVLFYRAGCGNGGASLLGSDTVTAAQAQSPRSFELVAADGGNVFPLTLLAVDSAGNTSEFASVQGQGLFANDFEDAPRPIGPDRCE